MRVNSVLNFPKLRSDFWANYQATAPRSTRASRAS